ncbi:MAG: chloride channel protein [Pedobacter sp.]|jgi:H+/Cl- antiporter ClcA
MSFLVKLRLFLKQAFSRIRNEEIKRNLLQAIPFWIASVITGIVAVIYSRVFSLAEKLAANIYTQDSKWLFVLTPTCFLISWWIVKQYASYAKGSGIPQVMAAIDLSAPNRSEVVNKLLGFRIIIVKIISSLIMACGGGAIGREGPTIQISASIFRIVNEKLPTWMPKIAKKNILVTGAAAGLAAAFNTPLGGIVFAIEELTKTHFSFYKTAIFSSVIIAGLTAQGLIGPYLYLGYPQMINISAWVVAPVILVAVIAGISGSGMSKLVLAILRWKSGLKSTRHHVVYIIISALAFAAIAYFNPVIIGSGKHIMEQVLFTGDKHSTWYNPFLRIIGPVLSFTSGGAGGIFAPALGAGASIGSVIAGWFQLSESNTNLLALTGMVGFLTGVTRSPFTSTILVLEMTDRHSVIFYLILAGMVSSLISVLVDKHSLYDHLKHQYIRDLHREEKISNKKKL